jgi:hypothetical protein
VELPTLGPCGSSIMITGSLGSPRSGSFRISCNADRGLKQSGKSWLIKKATFRICAGHELHLFSHLTTLSPSPLSQSAPKGDDVYRWSLTAIRLLAPEGIGGVHQCHRNYYRVFAADCGAVLKLQILRSNRYRRIESDRENENLGVAGIAAIKTTHVMSA